MTNKVTEYENATGIIFESGKESLEAIVNPEDGTVYIDTRDNVIYGVDVQISLTREDMERLIAFYREVAPAPTRKVTIENSAEDSVMVSPQWTEDEIKVLRKLERVLAENKPTYAPTFTVKEEA